MASPLFKRMLRATQHGAFPGLRRFAWRGTYEAISAFGRAPRWGFLNYGYLPAKPFDLMPEDEGERAFIGLYGQAVAGLPMAGARVLEVGSGHGGGASWMARATGAASVTGVDLSRATVRVARRRHRGVPGLDFRPGDAEALPFPDGAFDIVVNIESSHCYGRMDRFVAEAARVLRPGGWLTWADMRSPDMVPALDAAFAHPALSLEGETLLNAGVVAALDAMDAAKAAEIAKAGPLRPALREFAGMRGSRLHAGLARERVLYLARRYRRG